jgi:hypothetical protein
MKAIQAADRGGYEVLRLVEFTRLFRLRLELVR